MRTLNEHSTRKDHFGHKNRDQRQFGEFAHFQYNRLTQRWCDHLNNAAWCSSSSGRSPSYLVWFRADHGCETLGLAWPVGVPNSDELFLPNSFSEVLLSWAQSAENESADLAIPSSFTICVGMRSFMCVRLKKSGQST